MSDEVVTKGISRLAYQFSDSEKFKGFLSSFLAEYEELNVSGLQLLNERYLDTSAGVQLDGIGEIVGLPRPEKDVDIAGIFGFIDDPTSLGFGSILDLDIGGNFWDGISQSVLIGDDLYRLLIRAKIIKNQTAMTVDDTIRLISFTFGNVDVRYFLVTNLHPRYDISKSLTAFEADLIGDFPILIGIEDVQYHTHEDELALSFSDDVEGLGLGDINDTDIGGIFAKIIT